MVLTKILRLLSSIGLVFLGLGVLYATTEPTIAVNVAASSYAVLPGETFTATVEIDVLDDEGCTVGMYLLSLNSTPTSVLTITSPSVLGPPVPITPTFSLQATNVGTATLQAEFLSELNCGFWMWKDYGGESPAILVANQLSKLYLPLISR
jgi:hypothetical protein